jgi:H/ACA ribonucleoprotein complex subunit 2
MAKDEVKKEKKSKRKSEGNLTEVGEDSIMSVSATPADKKSKKEKKEKKVKTEDEDEDMDEDAVAKGEVSPEAISPIAREYP